MDDQVYITRLNEIQELLILTFSNETMVKVIKKLIDREKWGCKILMSLILRLLKHCKKEGQPNPNIEQEAHSIILY